MRIWIRNTAGTGMLSRLYISITIYIKYNPEHCNIFCRPLPANLWMIVHAEVWAEGPRQTGMFVRHSAVARLAADCNKQQTVSYFPFQFLKQ